MKVVLLSLMLLLAFITIDCSPLEEEERSLEEEERALEEEQRSPAKGESPPAEGESPPAEGESPPAEGESPPAKGESPPAEGESPPAEGERSLEEKARKVDGSKIDEYTVIVETGNRMFAGTDANVFIRLIGSISTSPEIPLSHDYHDDFQSGHSDTYIIKAKRVGDISMIWIHHDNWGFGPGWFLNKVTVIDGDTDKWYEFPCYRWLAKDADDGQIFRKLKVS